MNEKWWIIRDSLYDIQIRSAGVLEADFFFLTNQAANETSHNHIQPSETTEPPILRNALILHIVLATYSCIVIASGLWMAEVKTRVVWVILLYTRVECILNIEHHCGVVLAPETLNIAFLKWGNPSSYFDCPVTNSRLWTVQRVRVAARVIFPYPAGVSRTLERGFKIVSIPNFTWIVVWILMSWDYHDFDWYAW